MNPITSAEDILDLEEGDCIAHYLNQSKDKKELIILQVTKTTPEEVTFKMVSQLFPADDPNGLPHRFFAFGKHFTFDPDCEQTIEFRFSKEDACFHLADEITDGNYNRSDDDWIQIWKLNQSEYHRHVVMENL